MSSQQTPVIKQCEILGTLWLFHRDTDDETWSDFFEWADLGCPLAYLIWQGLATATDDGTATIGETWTVFCELIDIDPDGSYDSLEDTFEASSHEPLEG